MSSPTQHRALHIAEVFRHICDVADNSTLAILARTCRAFQGPALQALWRFPARYWSPSEMFPSRRLDC
ncbi:hypothetical protein C8T65DRAFT_643683 [Cerioporus squamosus]|nr:hypothetical protein C8T65DRAFT_643683 [Cerioporus squamosus]